MSCIKLKHQMTTDTRALRKIKLSTTLLRLLSKEQPQRSNYNLVFLDKNEHYPNVTIITGVSICLGRIYFIITVV